MTPAVGDYNNDGYPDIYATEYMLRRDRNGETSASRLFRWVAIGCLSGT